jgi:hypothetical protein
MRAELAEDLLDNLPVLGPVRVHNEDVIEVHHDITRQDEVLDDVVHHCLEGGWGVGKAEVYHQRLEEPRLVQPFITFPDLDVV